MKVRRIRGYAIETWLNDLEDSRATSSARYMAEAHAILDSVRREGDRAVAQLLARYDSVLLEPGEIAISVESRATVNPDLEAALEVAIERIRRVHRQRTRPNANPDSSIRRVEVPFDRIGIYVPGGLAIYPSSLLMCAIPAIEAGVSEIIVGTTPRAAASNVLHYLCARLGIRSIYRGGAASIAAMTAGTESLSRVDKIVGPGSSIVAALKAAVQSQVGTDMIAGPSEVLVIADSASSLPFVRADLLAQAEHGPGALGIAICLEGTAQELARLIADGDEGAELLDRIVILEADGTQTAIEISDRIAPEHLSIQTVDPAVFEPEKRRAGVVYLGQTTPVALGDYIIGTNHVLPTGGSARFSSALGTSDFVRRMHVVLIDQAEFNSLAQHAAVIADEESLPRHASSLRQRLEVMK